MRKDRSYGRFEFAIATRQMRISVMSEPSATELLEGFGVRLATARIAAGYKTRKALSDAIDVDQNTYSPWERGRSLPSAKELLKLRRALRISLDWLLIGDDTHLTLETYRRLEAAQEEALEIKAKRDSKRTGGLGTASKRTPTTPKKQRADI